MLQLLKKILLHFTPRSVKFHLEIDKIVAAVATAL